MGIRTPVAGVKGRHDWPLHYSSMLCSVALYYTQDSDKYVLE